jgi:hypothetical protein
MYLNMEGFALLFSCYILAALFTNSANTRNSLVCTVVPVVFVVVVVTCAHLWCCSTLLFVLLYEVL